MCRQPPLTLESVAGAVGPADGSDEEDAQGADRLERRGPLSPSCASPVPSTQSCPFERPHRLLPSRSFDKLLVQCCSSWSNAAVSGGNAAIYAARADVFGGRRWREWTSSWSSPRTRRKKSQSGGLCKRKSAFSKTRLDVEDRKGVPGSSVTSGGHVRVQGSSVSSGNMMDSSGSAHPQMHAARSLMQPRAADSCPACRARY